MGSVRASPLFLKSLPKSFMIKFDKSSSSRESKAEGKRSLSSFRLCEGSQRPETLCTVWFMSRASISCISEGRCHPIRPNTSMPEEQETSPAIGRTCWDSQEATLISEDAMNSNRGPFMATEGIQVSLLVSSQAVHVRGLHRHHL